MRSPLLAVLAACTPLAASPALGAAPDPEPSGAVPPETGLPPAAGTGADEPQAPIVVTARHRAESAQTVPLAISVIGGERIDNTGAFNVGRLQALTPAVQFYTSNPRNSTVNIRGLGAPFGLTNDGIEQGVGIYVDDVYYSRVASATFDFLDVGRIEILRGPQGTLYGKNTSAGAIAITTRQPTFNFEGHAEASAGNMGFHQLKAALSGPVTDTLAARIAVSATRRDGSIYDTTKNKWVNAQDNFGLRGQLLWKPSGAVEVTLAGDYSAQDPLCCAQVYVRTAPTQRATNRQYAALAAAQDYAVPSTDPFDRLTDVDADLSARNRIGGASLRVKAELGRGTLTAISAWRFWSWNPSNDRDYTGLAITTKSQNPSRQDQFTQEVRYALEGRRIDFVVGAFGFAQTIHTQGSQVQGPAASKWLIAPSNPLSNDPSVLDGLTATNAIGLANVSTALFGQATWKLSGRFRLQPGLRLNYDRKVGHYDSVVTDGAGALVTFSDDNTARQTAQLAVLAPQSFVARYSAWNLSGDFTAAYDLAPDVHAYVTYAHTFKSGGINLNGVPADASGAPLLFAATVDPERIDSFEAGVKSQFWNGRATANLAIYRTDVSDYQALVTNGQLGVLRGYLANADKVRSQGVEWDISLRPSERLSLYFNGAFADARYRKFTDAPCPPELSGGTTASAGQTPAAAGTPGLSPASCDISGQRMPGVSRWTLSWGGEINLPVGSREAGNEVYFGADASSRSSFSSNPTPSAYTWVEGYALVNLRAGYRTRSGLDFYVWVRNAFDVGYFEQLTVASGNTGLIVGSLGDPRTFGVTARWDF